jgi:hypothetical protein
MSGSAKFWGTLSIWKVLLIFLITNVVMALIAVTLREGLGIDLVGPGAGAAASGFVSVLIVSGLVVSGLPVCGLV